MRIISGTARGTKLYTLPGLETRPTLDRVKESVFNIIQQYILESEVLDLFAGSGAIGLEMLSRGAKRLVLCDESANAIKIIQKNVTKTHMEEKVEIYNTDFKVCIEKIKHQKFDLIYLDPPYNTDYIEQSLRLIKKYKILKEEGIIILETDNETRILKEIENIDVKVKDKRKYGRASIIFLK